MRFFEHQQQARAQTVRLLLLFALTLLLLVVAVNASLALTWQLLTWRLFAWQDASYSAISAISTYPAYFFHINTGVTLLFVLGGWWLESASLAGGGAQLARRAGARPAKVLGPLSRLGSQDTEQKFCNIVSELAIAASMKPPLPMVLDRVHSINAFACGWDPGDAVVAVTQGALDSLTRDELQGLVAHEFSHILEGDMQLNMRLAGMVSGLEMIFNLGCTMCEPGDDGRRSFLALPGFAIQVTGSLGWLAGRLLLAAVLRQREFLADARAVQFTRSKDGLGGVLRKAMGQDEQTQTPHRAIAHMLLLGPEHERWLATHPPIAERIRRIYGRPMGAIDSSEYSQEVAQTRPDAIF